VSPSVTAGFQPKVSPGGGQVAYFGRQSSGSQFASLFVKDLATSQITAVSNQCPLPGYTITPVEWAYGALAWSADGFLYFTEQGAEGAIIRRFDPRNGDIINISGVLKSRVFDLHLSPDGRSLAYLLHYDRTSQVRTWDLASKTDRVVHAWNDTRFGEIYLRGWEGDRLVAIRRFTSVPEPEWPAMEVFLVGGSGRRLVVRLRQAYAATARLSGAGELYYVGAPKRVANVYALDLQRGTSRRLTSNQLPSTSFSGIEPLADGSLIYSQNDRRQDIWLSRVSTVRSAQQ
jgi:hypothetical protein